MLYYKRKTKTCVNHFDCTLFLGEQVAMVHKRQLRMVILRLSSVYHKQNYFNFVLILVHNIRTWTTTQLSYISFALCVIKIIVSLNKTNHVCWINCYISFFFFLYVFIPRKDVNKQHEKKMNSRLNHRHGHVIHINNSCNVYIEFNVQKFQFATNLFLLFYVTSPFYRWNLRCE